MVETRQASGGGLIWERGTEVIVCSTATTKAPN
jgi:hypothetical protein